MKDSDSEVADAMEKCKESTLAVLKKFSIPNEPNAEFDDSDYVSDEEVDEDFEEKL